MPDELSFICDAPLTLEADANTSRVQIAKQGEGFNDPRYGKFAITAADFANWKKSLSLRADGTVPLDIDHAIEKGGSSEAAGWVTDIEAEGRKLFAKVEWTPAGAEAVRSKRYKFISPAFGKMRDETGKVHENALRSVTLTNRPFLNMPAVCLSRDPLFAQDGDDASDSRRHMARTPEQTLATIAEHLKLDADADEAKILEAVEAQGTTIAELEAKVDEAKDGNETKTLEEQAKSEGKVVLDSGAYNELKTGAAAGIEAKQKLSDQRFDTTFTKALDEVRVDAKPETRDSYKTLYEADPDTTISLLDSLPKLAGTSAKGEGGSKALTDAPEGVDTERFQLDQDVKAYMAEHKETDYTVALDAVMAEQVAA